MFLVISYVSVGDSALLLVRQAVTSSKHGGAAGYESAVWALEADKPSCSVWWAQITPTSRVIAVKWWVYAGHPRNAWHSVSLGFFVSLLSLLEKNCQ